VHLVGFEKTVKISMWTMHNIKKNSKLSYIVA